MDLPASVVRKKLKDGFGPGVLIRASAKIADDDNLVAGAYEYIQVEDPDPKDMEDLMEVRAKMLADLEEIKRWVIRVKERERRRRSWFFF